MSFWWPAQRTGMEIAFCNDLSMTEHSKGLEMALTFRMSAGAKNVVILVGFLMFIGLEGRL
jgi:hypothetical protein